MLSSSAFLFTKNELFLNLKSISKKVSITSLIMGNMYDKYISNPEGTPTAHTAPTFQQELGFPSGRKPRVMIATEEEMDGARLSAHQRDYCAHILLKLMACKSEHWPWVVKCHHQKEEYAECKYEDYVLRMKEYEREKRLLRRQQRIEARAG